MIEGALTIGRALDMSSSLAEMCPPITDTPRLDAEILLCYVLSENATYLRTWPDKALSAGQASAFNALLEQRLAGKPIAHITGQRGFWSLDLAVNESTLIPRPDTECLVEYVLEQFDTSAVSVLDLGTGTGAIALALASERPKWDLIAGDYSADAVALAEANRINNELSNVLVRQGSWFEVVPQGKRFALIVSNPPYIDPSDAHLSQGDVRFEPLSALVADKKGMADIEYILEHAPNFLMQSGAVVLEHGYDQAQDVRNAFIHRGFTHVESFKDYGDNDRFTTGKWAR